MASRLCNFGPSLTRYTRRSNWSCVSSKRYLSSKAQHDPLHVLFCGADEFSIHSLRALNKIRLENPEKVSSIDVVCRKDKRVGRGLKQIREVPIKSVAGAELGLDVHQIDTFTGWTPPQIHDQPFNMVVAVSFGLLVPPRILNAAKYGGLNVHPSMLPDLRGPAPLHHTLLRRLEKTGVTLQTLHPKHFDEGRIIDQTPSPGLAISESASSTVDSLLEWIGPLGAEMLYTNIMNGSFASTTNGKSQHQTEHGSTEHDLIGRLTDSAAYPRHARKITPEDRHLNFNWPVDEILLRDRVLGRLFVQQALPLSPKRITFHGLEDVTSTFQELGGAQKASSSRSSRDSPGAVSIFKHDKQRRIFFQAQGGHVSPTEVTIEGKPKQKASNVYQQLLQNSDISSG